MQSDKSEKEISALAAELTQRCTQYDLVRLTRLLMPSAVKSLLSSEDFDAIIAVLLSQPHRRQYSDKSIAAAKLVLVGGMSVDQASQELGLGRMIIQGFVQRISALFEGLPDDWVEISEWFPDEVASQLVDISAYLKNACRSRDSLALRTFMVFRSARYH